MRSFWGFTGNLFRGLAGFLREAAKPEWFIKTAIVYLGIKLGLMSMKATGFAVELALAGAAAMRSSSSSPRRC